MKGKHRQYQRGFSVDGRRQRHRPRAGANVSRLEYEGRVFDQTFQPGHVGPGWFPGRRARGPDHEAFARVRLSSITAGRLSCAE